MGQWGRIRIPPPRTLARIDQEPGIGPARVQPQFHDLAIGIEILTEMHLLPVKEAEITSLGIILAPKGKIGIAHGLKTHALNGTSPGIEYFDERIQLRS